MPKKENKQPAPRGAPLGAKRRRRARAAGAAVADDALAFVYEVALTTVAELMDATGEGAAAARDAWVLVLTSVPMLDRALRAACPLDASVAATLAYERMRMFGDGGRRKLPRALKGDPLWYMWGVPPVLDLGAARSASPPPFAIVLCGEGDVTPSDVRTRRVAAVRAIERGLRAEGCARRGWHRCADLPHVHAKVSTYVVWMRSLAVAVERLSAASAACLPRVCEHPRCSRTLVARRTDATPAELARRATTQTLADVVSRVDQDVLGYWACALAPYEDSSSTAPGGAGAAPAPAPATHSRFCSPSCREGWVDAVWSRLPLRPCDLRTPESPRDRPGSGARIDGELAAAIARNCVVAARLGDDDAWRTSAWWARPGADPPPACLAPVCIAATAALVQALNVDLALLVGASTVAGTRLPFGTRQLLPGGSADWRGAGAFWRPMLAALTADHEAVPEPVPVGRQFHFEHSAFVRRARAGTLALFDRQFGTAPRQGAACTPCTPFGGCDCGCAPKAVPRAGAHRALSA